jgi:hypothetical protein
VRAVVLAHHGVLLWRPPRRRSNDGKCRRCRSLPPSHHPLRSQGARTALAAMESAGARLAGEDPLFQELDGRTSGSLSGHAGLGRAFRLARWTGDGRCLEACNAAYEEVRVWGSCLAFA